MLASQEPTVFSPSRKHPVVSSPKVSYVKACEVIIYNIQQLRTTIWARSDAHRHLSSRYKFLHKCLTFPSVILATLITSGTFFSSESKNQTIANALGVLSAITTLLVTFSTHFDFASLSESHKHTEFALRRFDRRLEQFLSRLRFKGNHARSGIDEMTEGRFKGNHAHNSIDETTEGDGSSTSGASGPFMEDSEKYGKRVEDADWQRQSIESTIRGLENKSNSAPFKKHLEDLLEGFDQLGDQYDSILENAPDLHGVFTGLHLCPAFMSFQMEKDFDFDRGKEDLDKDKDGAKREKKKRDILRKPLNAPGKCYDFHYIRARRFMQARMSRELGIEGNVENWAEKIDVSHSIMTPFNRSHFEHVALEVQSQA